MLRKAHRVDAENRPPSPSLPQLPRPASPRTTPRLPSAENGGAGEDTAITSAGRGMLFPEGTGSRSPEVKVQHSSFVFFGCVSPIHHFLGRSVHARGQGTRPRPRASFQKPSVSTLRLGALPSPLARRANQRGRHTEAHPAHAPAPDNPIGRGGGSQSGLLPGAAAQRPHCVLLLGKERGISEDAPGGRQSASVGEGSPGEDSHVGLRRVAPPLPRGAERRPSRQGDVDGLESARRPGSPGERVEASNVPLTATAHFGYQEPPSGEEQEERTVGTRRRRSGRRGERRRRDAWNKEEFCSAAFVTPATDRGPESTVAACRHAGKGRQEEQSA